VDCDSERQGGHREKVRARRRGEPFTSADFKKVAPITTVRRELQRLVQTGKIKAVAEDLFVKPKTHKLLGEMSPTLPKIVRALTTKQGHVCQINGGEAANRLGLSPDVPMTPIYLTNGPSRLVMLGKLELEFRHKPIEELPAAGQMAGDVIQAFQYLGPRRVRAKQVAWLNKTLDPETKARLRKLARRLPPWMREVIEQFE
jgi:hypothetical protein